MPTPDEIFANWHGPINNDIFETIRETFTIPSNDTYIYRADSFAMTLPDIETRLQAENLKYRYAVHGKQIEIPESDITAYTTLFSPSVSSQKALIGFSSNAKKLSPRSSVATYLLSRRLVPSNTVIPRSKNHLNPYYDLWALSCHMLGFVGPLDSEGYADTKGAMTTHPLLAVFFHVFGCVVPSWEGLSIISRLVKESEVKEGEIKKGEGCKGVVEIGSGNGYWTFLLRRMGVDVLAVDNGLSSYRVTWISDTVKVDGSEWLKANKGGEGRVLLLVYPVTKGGVTRGVLKKYRGEAVVVVGTMNGNRFTGFEDCTVEEFFEREMGGWELVWRVAMPSFAGKDEGLFVWRRKG